MARLDRATARRFAALTLSHLDSPWPHKFDHIMAGPDDLVSPVALHPIFHGSFDWHSCVHGWWQVMRLRRRYPDLPEAARIVTLANRLLVSDNVAVEAAYLDRPGGATFERPYGAAWLLALHGELAQHDDRDWATTLAPLARAFAAQLADYVTKLPYPTRSGAHANTAFALFLAHDWAVAHDTTLAGLIADRAVAWFGGDRDCPAWEPDGDAFLSPALIEAVLMTRLLHRDDAARWLAAFLPGLARGEPACLFAPAAVPDRGDGKIVHLDGLNLSRAWCWRLLARHAAPDAPLAEAATRHLAASLGHLDDSYMGGHWLATFALLALDPEG